VEESILDGDCPVSVCRNVPATALPAWDRECRWCRRGGRGCWWCECRGRGAGRECVVLALQERRRAAAVPAWWSKSQNTSVLPAAE